jgi:integrase
VQLLNGLTSLAKVVDGALAKALDPALVARAEDNTKRPLSQATKRAYARDWGRFEGWCSDYGLTPLPAPELVIVQHLTWLAQEGYRYSTIARAYASVRAEHVTAGCPLPTLPAVTNALWNLGRQLGKAQNGKAALMNDTVREVARGLSDEADDESVPRVIRLLAARDAALLTLGFSAARRRSELTDLDVRDLTFNGDGVVLLIRRSKTDQDGKGELVGVPFGRKGSCPVRALRRWLDLTGVVEGPVFRSIDASGRLRGRLAGQGVWRAVKRALERAGIEPKDYGAHSLRVGLVTSAERAGKSLAAIMRQTKHRDQRQVLKYARPATLFVANAAEGLL